eukprot:CAMPEP_0206427092 /NCGR_PEP_ID=MMETSP0324_2-20121206/4811_1 /ASSEMBLY_ACC=CAM_ASM_000836 /TAXON_ID=2866 /ORGANISM="Crypthecodinium cohnii, Strain Seligo" /LENGTH=83 /DNA_ID=CAMNT_0053892259 /DNA_START=359 /DNA_END=610 /DNA_ORIENTATION=+
MSMSKHSKRCSIRAHPLLIASSLLLVSYVLRAVTTSVWDPFRFSGVDPRSPELRLRTDFEDSSAWLLLAPPRSEELPFPLGEA